MQRRSVTKAALAEAMTNVRTISLEMQLRELKRLGQVGQITIYREGWGFGSVWAVKDEGPPRKLRIVSEYVGTLFGQRFAFPHDLAIDELAQKVVAFAPT